MKNGGLIPEFALPVLSFVILIAASGNALAGGGAWVKGPGGYYFKIGLTSLTADKEYGFEGEDRPIFRDTTRYRNGSLGITNLPFYGEYGITSWLTGTISTQYSIAVREATDLETGLTADESASGLGDTWLGARFKIVPDSWPVVGAATLLWKIPTGSPYKDIPLGTGVADYEAALGFGAGFPVFADTYGYVQATSGYRFRNRASDEINWAVEVGVGLIPSLGIQTRLDGSHSMADFKMLAMTPESDPVFMGLISDQSFLRFGSGLVYTLSDEVELSLNYDRILTGTNTLASNSFALGVAWKWSGRDDPDDTEE